MADPEIIGHYRLIAPIAEGSMGKVYLVEHEVTKRKLALKLLKPELFGGERARQRFLLEARAAGIEHPNLIQVTDAGEDDGQLYIVMRYVRGSDLGKALRAGPLAPLRTAGILSQIASALDASHDAGLIHRDVKPSNILVTSVEDPEGPDHAFLCDFGITKDADGPALTQTGFAPGTRAYMAPEQFKGREIAGTTDQYALACVAFEALTGRRPFEAQTEETLMYLHLSEDPPSASAVNRRLSSQIDAVLSRAMAKEAGSRYPTCVAFTDALREAIDTLPVEASVDLSETPTVVPVSPAVSSPASPHRARAPRRARRASLILLAVGVLLLAAGTGAGLLSRSRPTPTTAVSPGVTSIAPSPRPTSTVSASPIPVPTVADARLRGPYQVVLEYTGSRGLTRGGGAPFWHTWPIILKPVCEQGACDAKVDFRRFGTFVRGTLQRNGATYSGTLSTLGITTCDGKDSYGALQVLLRVVDGKSDGATWRADHLRGRMRYDSAQGACVPAGWTANVTATARG